MVFPVTLSVKLKCGKVSVAVPVTSRTTVSELKTSFIEAITNTLNQMRDPEPEPEVKAELATLLPLSTEDDPDPDPTVKTIKLFKQSEDEQGDEKWIPLDDDKANVDRIGLDQGHVVGVSFANKRGEYRDPVITSTELE